MSGAHSSDSSSSPGQTPPCARECPQLLDLSCPKPYPLLQVAADYKAPAAPLLLPPFLRLIGPPGCSYFGSRSHSLRRLAMTIPVSTHPRSPHPFTNLPSGIWPISWTSWFIVFCSRMMKLSTPGHHCPPNKLP
jgi:hypothetical protein